MRLEVGRVGTPRTEERLKRRRGWRKENLPDFGRVHLGREGRKEDIGPETGRHQTLQSRGGHLLASTPLVSPTHGARDLSCQRARTFVRSLTSGERSEYM